MFSEATRFKCVYLEIFDRIKNWTESSELETFLWNLINTWGHWSDEILDLWLVDPDFSNSLTKPLNIDRKKPNQCIEVRFDSSSTPRRVETVADLIGRGSQLTFMKRCLEKMISKDDLEAKKKFKAGISDPMFQKPKTEEEESEEGEEEP
jgi:hypothetical protein